MAGFAKAHGAVLLHKDPELQSLEGRIVIENLPYKSDNTPGKTTK